jgi:hypothetical protein
VPHAAQVSLCVQVARVQASSERGKAAQWTVSAWTTGGNVTDAVLRLQSAPASGGTPGFSFGCGKNDRAAACDLGAVDAKSAPRQLQAQLTVPATASDVKSVSLTVTGSTAHLAKEPKASATVAITAPPPAVTAGQNPAPSPPPPVTVTSPLPVGSLPGIPPVVISPTLSPGGNASGLFPTLQPTPSASPHHPASKSRTTPLANTSALPEGATVIGAQLAGLAALALAFVLAVTRLSIRRHPAQQDTPTPDSPPAKDPPGAASATDQDTPAPGEEK